MGRASNRKKANRRSGHTQQARRAMRLFENGLRALMQETMERLEVMENIDAVLVGVLLELRPRLGDPQHPAEAGGAAVYAALLDARTGTQLWNLVFDRTQRPANPVEKSYEVVVGGGNPHWLSAQGIAQEAALEMMSNMARSVR